MTLQAFRDPPGTIPTIDVHAAHPGQATTVCGRPVEGMEPVDGGWAGGRDACRSCAAVAGR